MQFFLKNIDTIINYILIIIKFDILLLYLALRAYFSFIRPYFTEFN